MNWVSSTSCSLGGVESILTTVESAFILPMMSWARTQIRTAAPVNFKNETSCIREKLMPPKQPFFRKLWPWYLTLTLTDDLDCGTKERVLPQGIYRWNMEALLCTIYKRAMMAPDRSSESILHLCSFGSNLWTPVLIPRGKLTKVYKEMLQKSKLHPFQFQRRRILKSVFFVLMFQLVYPGVGSVFTPKESYE